MPAVAQGGIVDITSPLALQRNLPLRPDSSCAIIRCMKKPSNEMIECACGCGNMLTRFDSRGRERRFLHNHHAALQPNKRESVICENCGKQFDRPQWHTKRVNHHFCSQACEGEWTTKTGRRSGKNNGHFNTIEVACAGGCGASVSKAASLVNRRNGNVYCPDCVKLVRQGREGFYVGYPPEFSAKLRKQIRERDHYTCQNCSTEQKHVGYTLHVHHIDYDKHNSAPMNLVSLCRNCHGLTNFGKEQWQKKFEHLMNLRFGERV